MKNSILLFILFFCVSVYSQDKDHNFFDRLTLRKSFESKDSEAEPATFTYTKPKNKDESWLLNAAVGINILPCTREILTLAPYFEYHRNTLIDKEQNNWQTGLSLEWQTQNLAIKNWSPIFISALKYNQDEIQDISSFQGNIYFTPLFKGKGGKPEYFYLPSITSNFWNLFTFSYSPYIGLENENRIKTENDVNSGNIYRGYVRLTSSVLLFPNSKKLENKFEFNMDWQYRYNLSENVESLNKNEHIFFTASFNYTVFSKNEGKRSAKIGIDYVNGENPLRSFEKQSYYALTLKVKL